MDIEETVTDIIVKRLGVSPSEVRREASFIDDLGADSLDGVDIVMDIEQRLQVAISSDAMADFIRVGDVLNYLAGQSLAVSQT